MTSIETGPFVLALAVAWFGAGVYVSWVALRSRAYVNSLPPTRGNRQVRRRNTMMLVIGVGMVAIGLWNTFAIYSSSSEK